jgi:hypothetical protein
MSNPLVVLLIVLLGAALVYLLVSFGVFGGAGRAARSRDDADDIRSRQDGT